MSPRRGFTIVEVLIILCIIGILAAIAIPKFKAIDRNARQSQSVCAQMWSLARTHTDTLLILVSELRHRCPLRRVESDAR